MYFYCTSNNSALYFVLLLLLFVVCCVFWFSFGAMTLWWKVRLNRILNGFFFVYLKVKIFNFKYDHVFDIFQKYDFCLKIIHLKRKILRSFFFLPWFAVLSWKFKVQQVNQTLHWTNFLLSNEMLVFHNRFVFNTYCIYYL